MQGVSDVMQGVKKETNKNICILLYINKRMVCKQKIVNKKTDLMQLAIICNAMGIEQHLLDVRYNSSNSKCHTLVNAKLKKNGFTALHFAVESGSECDDVVWMLIDNGAKVDARDNNMITPLMHAAYTGHFPMVKALVESGADVNISSRKNGYLENPLYYAIDHVHEMFGFGIDGVVAGRNGIKTIKYLLNKGARVTPEIVDGVNDDISELQGIKTFLTKHMNATRIQLLVLKRRKEKAVNKLTRAKAADLAYLLSGNRTGKSRRLISKDVTRRIGYFAAGQTKLKKKYEDALNAKNLKEKQALKALVKQHRISLTHTRNGKLSYKSDTTLKKQLNMKYKQIHQNKFRPIIQKLHNNNKKSTGKSTRKSTGKSTRKSSQK
jgi:hypothetical protein